MLLRVVMEFDVSQHLRAWGSDAEVLEKLSGGSRSDVWLVEVGGERCVARRSRRTPAAVAWELDLLEYLGDQGVRVPRVLTTRTGERQSRDVTLLSWVEGTPPESEAEWQGVAQELGRIHALTVGWPQRPTFASTQDLLTASHGGDVDLSVMPPQDVERCRDAWRMISTEPRSAIHGDPRGNVLITDEGVAFIDWDEARMDASILDLADLPFSERTVERGRLALGRRAASAWEAACGWTKEPEYARRRLTELG
jgi:Ser/Thr protein kinase RdoA (MazF antagonist)